MISHEKLASYFDMLVVCGGMAFVLLRYGQMRLPMPPAKRQFFSLATQLIFTTHFAFQAGINAFRPDGNFLFYVNLGGALSGFLFALHFYTLLERQFASSI